MSLLSDYGTYGRLAGIAPFKRYCLRKKRAMVIDATYEAETLSFLVEVRIIPYNQVAAS